MILPSKHLSTYRSLIGIGSEILRCLDRPRTVSDLWDKMSSGAYRTDGKWTLGFSQFVLALDFLYVVDLVRFDHGVLMRSKSR